MRGGTPISSAAVNVLNCLPWLEKILKFSYLNWLKRCNYCPPWLQKILKFTDLKWLKKCTYIVHHGWKKFEIYSSQVAKKIHLNHPPLLEKILKYTHLKCLKIHLNCPPWLEKILKFTDLKIFRENCKNCFNKSR